MSTYFPTIEGSKEHRPQVPPTPSTSIGTPLFDENQPRKITTAKTLRENSSSSAGVQRSFASDTSAALLNARLPEQRIEKEPQKLFTPTSALSFDLPQQTDLYHCIAPLLEAMGGQGDTRRLNASMPQSEKPFDITAMRNLMANLGFKSQPLATRLSRIKPDHLPCLFLPHDGDAMVVLGADGDAFRIYQGGTRRYQTISARGIKGQAYIFQAQTTVPQSGNLLSERQGWLQSIAARFHVMAYQILALTLFVNLLALLTPLFTMAVIDQIVSIRALDTMIYFAAGVGLAMACEFVLRGVRARMFSYLSARLENIVGTEIFRRLLFMPPVSGEGSAFGATIARLTDFDSIPAALRARYTLALVELPFVAVFIAAIGALAGPLAFVPIIAIGVFALFGLIVHPVLQKRMEEAERNKSHSTAFLRETLMNMQAIQGAGCEHEWLDRFRESSSQSSMAGLLVSRAEGWLHGGSSLIVGLSVLAALVTGSSHVFDGSMTIGVLIAIVILVGRAMAPVQSIFVALAELARARFFIAQINTVMNQKPALGTSSTQKHLPDLVGAITFSQVSSRHDDNATQTLSDISFDVAPGEILAVYGADGAGKSSLLRMLAGLDAPDSGRVLIDGIDVYQGDTESLRLAMSYVAHGLDFSPGSIAQNLRMAHPTASFDELRWAVNEAGVLQRVESLEYTTGKTAFDVDVPEPSLYASKPLLQGLNLARGYIRRSPVLLLDEPATGLDEVARQVHVRKLESLRGNTSVIIATHEHNHLNLADKILWLDSGQVHAFGDSAQIIAQIDAHDREHG